MKRIFAKVLFALFLSVVAFGAAVSPASAACDNGVPDGGEARNSGNGCTYRCSGSSWSGPLRCDGQGNGQFQGAAAKSTAEKQAQANAVAQREKEAEKVVAQQGTAATSALAASTAEQRAKEATRQQAMVEAQRQADVDLAKRAGATAADIAKIEADAKAAAAFVAQAQGTDRGQSIVGSGAGNAAAIAEAGYDPTGALATGNVTVSGGAITAGVTRATSATGGGTDGVNLGSDEANAALYTGADKCDINGGGDNVAPGGSCCRGGKVECANSGICSAGSVGQTGKCSTNGLTSGDPTARAVAFRNANGTVTNIPILATGSTCSGNTRSCSYAGGVACVSSATYSDSNGGCANWLRDVESQASRGSSEAVVASSNTCTGSTRGCHYGGGWVCVDRVRYPEDNANGADTSNGCAAWHRDFTGTSLVGGTVKFKVTNGSCVSCATGDSASVCAYSTLAQCNSALVIARSREEGTSSPVRYRLDGGSCIACRTQQDASQYNCQYTEASCGNRGGARSNVQPGRACSNGPCYCSSTGALIENTDVCPTDFQADRTAVCPAGREIVTSSGANRTVCQQDGRLKYYCNSGTSANNCAPTVATNPVGPNTSTAEQNASSGLYRLDGSTCRACTVGDATRYECRYATSDCGARPGTNVRIGDGDVCAAGETCFCTASNNSITGGTNGTTCRAQTPYALPEPGGTCTQVHGQPTNLNPPNSYCCNGRYSVTACSEPIQIGQARSNGQLTGVQSALPVRTFCGTTTNRGECDFCARAREGEGATYSLGDNLYCRYSPDEAIIQVDALVAPVACTPEGQSPSGESLCCANMTAIAEISGDLTRNVCRSFNALTRINQDTSTGNNICTDPDGCVCRQENNSTYHVAEGVSCPNYLASAGGTLNECSGTTVEYGTAYSDACKVGFGLRATCKSGFREQGGRCVSSSVAGTVLSFTCSINPNLPQCPNNPNGQYLSIGQTCARSADCFCNGGFMNGNVCTAYTPLNLGGECPSGSSQCTCNAGKMVGNKCVPKDDQSYCFSMSSGSTSCINGYRYSCESVAGPVGQNTWIDQGMRCDGSVCTPGAVQCQGERNFNICRTDGTGWIEGNSCALHSVCVQSAGRCVDNRPLEIMGNECRLLSEREYAVNLPQCSSGSYVCEHGVSRSINGTFVCPSPSGSYDHGCPADMYYELLAGECRNRADTSIGLESYAGYQCTGSTVNSSGTVRQLCHECGRQGQPACTNCYGQDPNSDAICATNLAELGRATGGYVIVPTGQTAQEFINDVFGYVCNKVGEPNCRPCGGQGQQACPIQNSQDSTVELATDCAQVRLRFPTNASTSCRAGNVDVVTNEATPVREGTTCSLFTSVTLTTPRVDCSLCGVYPEAACPTTQDYFTSRNLSEACNLFKAANVRAASATCN